MFCQKCGGLVLQVEHGGCGGYGSIHQCQRCNQVYEQTSGGIVGTPGGEIFRPLLPHLAKIYLKEKTK